MSFLFPAMLAGFAALAVPVVLHLIARQRFPVLNFPTIRLLQGERRTNTLAPRLVDKWQLLLRLLVLLLLVLAMARLFAPWLSGGPATHNTVIVIDASAGMMQTVDRPDGKGKVTLFELAKERAAKLLGEVGAPSRTSVIVAGGETTIAAPLRPGHEHAIASLTAVNAYDASGAGLVEAVARACDMLRGRREVSSEVIVLTDMRRGAFDYRGRRDLERIAGARAELGDSLRLLFVDLAPQATENLGITSAYVRGRTVMVGADAHVISTIANTGTKEQTAKVTLAVGERKEPVNKTVKIAPGASAVVDLTSRVNRAMRTFAGVSIDEDAYAADDSFAVPLPVVDSRRVLIVNGGQQGGASGPAPGAMAGTVTPGNGKPVAAATNEPEIDGATILRFVLNPGRELGGTSNSGIDPVVVTPEAVAVQPLSKYEIVVLYDVSSLPDQVMGDLATFVAEGKALLVICSGKTAAQSFNRSLAAGGEGGRQALAPAGLGNDIESPTPLEISMKDMSHPIVSAFADARRGDLSVVRFQKIRALQATPADARVILETTAGQPLAIERAVGRGRVVMLTFGFELDRGNVARTRVFPPLMWRVVDYLTGQLRTLPPDQLVARTAGALDVSETNFSLTSELEIASAGATTRPAGGAVRLPPSADRTVMVDGLAPGRYLLQKARAPGDASSIVTYARGVTVQPDPRESDMTRVDGADLSRLFGERARTVAGELPADVVPRGGEFWKIFVTALFFAYALEAIAGFVSTARRERRRAPGEGVAA